VKKLFLLFLFVILASASFGQSGGFNPDHQVHVRILSSAKDSLYKITLDKYDSHVDVHPGEVKVRMERCKFIQHAYYNDYEDYNPNYDAAKSCVDSLLSDFPEDPQVLLFQTEFLNQDTLGAYYNLLEEKADNSETWENYRWILFKSMAEHFHYDGDYKKSAYYGEMAVNENDTLDLTLLLGEAHKNLSNNEIAIGFLTTGLDSTASAWELNQKGTLLLELGEADSAIHAFRLASEKGEYIQNASELAKALIEKGLFDDAREYLLKDLNASGTWNEDQKLHMLFKHDLDYGSADSAKTSYVNFVNGKFMNDPFGIYRIRLAMKSPLAAWSFTDVGRILLLLALIAGIMIIPYLWILPIHYFGNYQRSKGVLLPQGTFHWTMRHFWIASSLWIFCHIFSGLIFDYPGTISAISESSVEPEFYEGVSKTMADINIFFFTISLIFCLGLIRNEDIKGFLPAVMNNGRAIANGVGLAFILKIGTMFYVLVMQGFGITFNEEAPSIIASIQDHIVSINTFYNPWLGFLFVAILVPFYEEILFRGVFLSATERNMRFVFANILQSTVFALVHQEWKLFPFYFAFGMIAGHWTSKTKSLITSTSMHMANNFLAFLFILHRS
jgi:uncharacterized protein